MVDNIYDTPPINCPNCGHFIDAASTIDKDEGAPQEGDYSLCLYCNAALVFNKELKLDLLNPEDTPLFIQALQRKFFKDKVRFN